MFRKLTNAARGLKSALGFAALVVTVLGVELTCTIFMFGADARLARQRHRSRAGPARGMNTTGFQP